MQLKRIKTGSQNGDLIVKYFKIINSTYPTTREKAREDFVEMLNGDLCKKYLKLLSSDEHKNFRDNNGLATITKEDTSKLQNIFDSIIHFYENLNNQ